MFKTAGNIYRDQQHRIEQGFHGHVAQFSPHLGADHLQPLDAGRIVRHAQPERLVHVVAQVFRRTFLVHGKAQQVIAGVIAHLLHGQARHVDIRHGLFDRLVLHGPGKLDLHHHAAREVHAVTQAAVHEDGHQSEQDDHRGKGVGVAPHAHEINVCRMFQNSESHGYSVTR